MMPESPLLKSRLELIALATLLCLGSAIRVANLGIETGRSPDETNYTAQANTVLQHGTAGLRHIAEEYQRDPAARLAGPPTRAGYLWALAATMRLTGKNDESVGAVLSCVASIGSLIILALIGVRFFPPWATLFPVLFLAVSPAELELARRTWTDALVGFLGLSLVYVSGEITRDPQRRVWHWLFLFVGSLGIVVKEFGPVVFGLCAMWVLWIVLVQRRDFRNGLALMAGVMAITVISIAWLAHSIGGFSALAQTASNWLNAHETNQYAIEYQSGPGHLLLRAFYVISPVSALFCVVGLGAALLPRGLSFSRVPANAANWQVIRWIAVFSLGYLALPMFLPHWLNLRYVSVLFGPFYLLAGLGFWYVASACWKPLRSFSQSRDGTSRFAADRKGAVVQIAFATVVVLGLAIGAYSDYRRFDRMFVRNGLGDLSIKLVLDRADMTAAEKRVKRAPTAENYLNLCWLYDQNWRYQDSIAACQKALQLRPDYAEAYNGLAIAYINLEMWEEAIEAAQRALEINPGLAPARDNLARSLHEKGLRE